MSSAAKELFQYTQHRAADTHTFYLIARSIQNDQRGQMQPKNQAEQPWPQERDRENLLHMVQSKQQVARSTAGPECILASQKNTFLD